MGDDYDTDGGQEITSFVNNLQKIGHSSAQIGQMLSLMNRSLTSIVELGNAEITKAFLTENGDILEVDCHTCVDLAMSRLDIPNIEVLLSYGVGAHIRRFRFLDCFVTMSTAEEKDLTTVRLFVEQIIKWKIFDDDAIYIIEYRVFSTADAQVIRIFLECDFDNHFQKKFHRSILPWIYANRRQSVIEVLENMRGIQPNVVGKKGFTPLHVASGHQCFNNMKLLLDRGARPNVQNVVGQLPLTWVAYDVQKRPKESTLQCTEILLQYGADMFIRSIYRYETIERTFVDIVIMNRERYGCLIELTLAHLAIRMDGAFPEGIIAANLIKDPRDKFWRFYNMCCGQLNQLKNDRIRGEHLTMFTIISKTGEKLFGSVHPADRTIILDKINKSYNNINILNAYYMRTLKEHMRQLDIIIERNNTE